MDFLEQDEQCDENLCRVCLQQGCFELSENGFEHEKEEVTLLTAFNSFSSLDNNNEVAIYLCQSCTEQLMDAYNFAQKVKVSDQRFSSKLLQDDVDVALEVAKAYDDKLNDIVEILEAGDDIEAEKSPSILKRMRKNRRPNETVAKRTKRESSPKKPTQSVVVQPVNFALAQYVITSSTPDEDGTTDEHLDENAASPLELDEHLLDDGAEGQTLNFDSETSPTRNKIKTLKTSTIVASNLQEIGDLCAITIDGDHDGQSIYQCKYCPKAFAGPYHLMIHTRKSHQCQYCMSAFVKVADLYKHVKEAHNSFDCLLCGRTFRTNGNLRQHMRKNHSVFLPAHVSLLNANDAMNNEAVGDTPQ